MYPHDARSEESADQEHEADQDTESTDGLHQIALRAEIGLRQRLERQPVPRPVRNPVEERSHDQSRGLDQGGEHPAPGCPKRSRQARGRPAAG